MSNNSSVLEFDDIVKEEYEVHLYGFSLSQFAEENFQFVEEEIKDSMETLKKKLFGTIKDIKPEAVKKISKITDEVCEDILKMARKDTARINSLITEKLKIPENVLLYADHAHARTITKEEIEELEKEVEQLEKLAWENDFFINALNKELSFYDDLEETFCTAVMVANKAEEQLDVSLGTDLNLNMLKKIREL